jgi:hypothetical protein
MSGPSGAVASTLARLRNIAEAQGLAFNDVLQSYAIERFLARVARLPDADSVLLKGALMLTVWGVPRARPTMDIDLLKRGKSDQSALVEFVTRCAQIEDARDAVEFDLDTLSVEPITEDADYIGTRIRLVARLGNVRQTVQVDFGVGDAVVPSPIAIDYPVMLGGLPPRLQGYPAEAAIAEKYQTLVVRDLANSRMKDFYDIWVLSKNLTFKREVLVEAINATFARRNTIVPGDIPPGLTSAYAQDPARVRQWRAFVNRIGAAELSDRFPDIVTDIVGFLRPMDLRATDGTHWQPGGPWATG